MTVLKMPDVTTAPKPRKAADLIPEFKNNIRAQYDTPVIKTGFHSIDRILDGGLYEGLYVVGAISSLGKTSLILEMADNIAMNGNDVLFFSLEMSCYELMSKSISRHTFEAVSNDKANGRPLAKTSRGITAGFRYPNYTDEERYVINSAIDKYCTYASNIYICEGAGDVTIASVKQIVREHIADKKRRPIVVIDYIQILAPFDGRASDKQNMDKAAVEMKRLSRDAKIPVIGISSLNRANYNSKICMEAFKESGAIEYTSDVLIGLQLKGAGTKDFNVDEAKDKECREIELVMLKNRNGRTGTKIELNYYPMYNKFQCTESNSDNDTFASFDCIPCDNNESNPFNSEEIADMMQQRLQEGG